MSRGTKIKLLIPDDYGTATPPEQVEYLFKYLKEIGFSKHNFFHIIGIDGHDESIFEYYINTLPDVQEPMETEKLLGAYFLIHKLQPQMLSYEKFCKISTDIKGGFSLYYYKRDTSRTDIDFFRTNIKQWIDTVLDEPDDELDIETRRAEYRKYIEALDKLSKKINKKSTTYVMLTRPSSPIRFELSQIEKKLTRIQNDQTTTY